MKKVLIATTNIDKFKAVSKVFENTIFPKEEYIIESLSNIQLNLKDEKEVGTNLERARTKAINAFNALKESDYNYDFVVGLGFENYHSVVVIVFVDYFHFAHCYHFVADFVVDYLVDFDHYLVRFVAAAFFVAFLVIVFHIIVQHHSL